MNIKKIGENKYEVVNYRKAIDKDGKEVEIVDRKIKVSKEEIDEYIEQATAQKEYWEKIKADTKN
ncbi:MAG: hypothetical protein ACTSX6_03400 [Candidatus Heimdallarchaeaceae archaeon]